MSVVSGCRAPSGCRSVGRVTSTVSSTSTRSSRSASSSACRASRACLTAPRASPTRLPASALAAGGRAPISRLASASGERSPACASRTSLREARSVGAGDRGQRLGHDGRHRRLVEARDPLRVERRVGTGHRYSPRTARTRASTDASRSPVPRRTSSGDSGASYSWPDAGQVRQAAGGRLGVQALGVASGDDVERGVDVDLEELPGREQLASGAPVTGERARRARRTPRCPPRTSAC